MNQPFSPITKRGVIALLAVSVALVLQTSVLSHLAWQGVAPDVVLVVVVCAGLVAGSQFGMVLGFAAGLLVDLAPPADHVAGRWTLALLVVGYVAGRVRVAPDAETRAAPAVLPSLAAVAACSFLGSSLFALTGLVLQDRALGVPDLLHVVLVGVLMDLALTPFVVPWLARLLMRVEPGREWLPLRLGSR